MGLIREDSTAVPQPNKPVGVTEVVNLYTSTPDAKSRQIKVSGVIQAVVQAPVLQMFVTNHDEWWHLVEKTADKMLEYIERKSQ